MPDVDDDVAGGGGERPPAVQRVEDRRPGPGLGVRADVAGAVPVVGGGDEPEPVAAQQAVEDEGALAGGVGVLPERAGAS